MRAAPPRSAAPPTTAQAAPTSRRSTSRSWGPEAATGTAPTSTPRQPSRSSPPQARPAGRLPSPSANFATAGGGDGTYVVKSFATDTSGNVQAPGRDRHVLDRQHGAVELARTRRSVSGRRLVQIGQYRLLPAGRAAARAGASSSATRSPTAGSGPASSTSAPLGGTSTGWTTTPGTVSTPAGGPYDSGTFTWAEGTSSAPTETISGADAAGNTSRCGGA